MKKLILLSILLIIGCDNSTEPDDCASVIGGSAYLDNCNVCDNDPTNDCIQDCNGLWGGDAVLDECILGTWIAVNLEICGVEDILPSDLCLIFYENNTFERGCCGCEENQLISGTWSVEDDKMYLSGDDEDIIIFSSLEEDILVIILDISSWGEEEEPCLSNPTMTYTFHLYLNYTIGDPTEWICTTDYIPSTIVAPDSTAISGELTMMMPDTVSYFENRIYYSLDQCQTVCPNEPLEITTTASPDGTGEYFSMYCAGNN